MKRAIGFCVLPFLLNLAVVQEAIGDSETFRPTGWQEVVSEGIFANPQMAYDGELGDTTTNSDIDSEYYSEGLAFFFEPAATLSDCELLYTWTTTGCGQGIECPSHARLYLYSWSSATWSLERWVGNEPLLKRWLQVEEEYVGPQGQISVRFDAIAGRGMPGPGPGEFPVFIDLYDLYVRATSTAVQGTSWAGIKALFR